MPGDLPDTPEEIARLPASPAGSVQLTYTAGLRLASVAARPSALPAFAAAVTVREPPPP